MKKVIPLTRERVFPIYAQTKQKFLIVQIRRLVKITAMFFLHKMRNYFLFCRIYNRIRHLRQTVVVSVLVGISTNTVFNLVFNDRSAVIKKADKGSRVVVWDREDCITEAEGQLGDVTVYKYVNFKEKMLQDFAETSNNLFRNLKNKGGITEKQLK